MRQVTREEFFEAIFRDKLNVHPVIQPTPFPYTSHWMFSPFTSGSRVYGKSVDRENAGRVDTDYYLANQGA